MSAPSRTAPVVVPLPGVPGSTERFTPDVRDTSFDPPGDVPAEPALAAPTPTPSEPGSATSATSATSAAVADESAPPASRWLFRVGDFCGSYEVQAPLGQGGFGQVYRVRSMDGRQLALKAMLLTGERDKKAGRRLVQEARIMRDVEHVHVVRYHDLGLDEDTRIVWMTMELLEGRTLRRLLQDPREHLGVERTLWLGEQMALGAAALHAAGVVHRDMKPENVIVLAGDVVKVIDFGVAKHYQSSIRTTHSQPLGTALYMAPDYLSYQGRAADPRWDIYSLGVTLWEMLRRRHPFHPSSGEALSTAAVISHHIHTGIPPLHEVVPEYPRYLSEVIARATAIDPTRRLTTMNDFALQLREARRKWCGTFNPGPSSVRLSDVDTLLRSGPRGLPMRDGELSGPSAETTRAAVSVSPQQPSNPHPRGAAPEQQEPLLSSPRLPEASSPRAGVSPRKLEAGLLIVGLGGALLGLLWVCIFQGVGLLRGAPRAKLLASVPRPALVILVAAAPSAAPPPEPTQAPPTPPETPRKPPLPAKKPPKRQVPPDPF